MINPPRTLIEAKKYKYGWGWESVGYKDGFCSYEIAIPWPPFDCIFIQCSRKARYGPDNLYCGIHAEKALELY